MIGPNPTTGDVFVEVVNENEFLDLASDLTGQKIENVLDECALYDKGGEAVWTLKPTGMTKVTIPMGTQEMGTYILITKTGDLVLQHKLIKI